MKQLISKILSNEFYRGGIILTASSFIVNIFNYFFNFLAGRALGPQGYGEISALFSYITILTIPMAVVTTVIIQKIGSTDKEKLPYAKSLELYVNTKLKRYLPFLLITLLLIPFIPRITNLSPLAGYVLIPLLLLSVLTAIYNSLLQGLKLFLLISIVSLIITFLKLLGGIAALLNLGQLEVVLLFLFISSLAGYIASIYAFKFHTRNSASKATESVLQKRLIHIFLSPQFIITALSVAAITILNNIDIIFVKKFMSAQEAGLYSSWSLFAKAIFYILGPLLGVSYIFFTHTKDNEQQDKSFIFSLSALIVFGILSYIFYSFFASYIITIFFGDKFNGIIPYLGLASIYGSLYATILFINNFFLAKKHYFALILAITLPIYIIGLFFIPRNMTSIFTLNIAYGSIMVAMYIFAYLRLKNSV